METLAVILFFVFFVFLCVGGFMEQESRYWYRVWLELGKPNVKSVKELKEERSNIKQH